MTTIEAAKVLVSHATAPGAESAYLDACRVLVKAKLQKVAGDLQDAAADAAAWRSQLAARPTSRVYASNLAISEARVSTLLAEVAAHA
jgi:hypothetical protein